MPSNSQRPWRHHYVPEFYLSRWCNSSKKLAVLRWDGDCIRPAKMYARKQVGALPYLYRVGSDDDVILDGEIALMRSLDDRAAVAFQRVLSPNASFDMNDWEAVVHFLWALAARHPDTQSIIEDAIPDMLGSAAEEFASLLIDHAELRAKFEDPNIGPPALQLAIIAKASHEDNPIAKMPCEVLVFPAPLLITSINPLVSLPAIDDPQALHLAALAPNVAVVFSNHRKLLDIIVDADPFACASAINRLIALGSDTIIGTNETLVEGLRGYLGGNKRAPNSAALAREALKDFNAR